MCAPLFPALLAILPRSLQGCQNGGLFVSSSMGVGDSHVVFGQTFPPEKGNVRLCAVLMQQPVILSPKFRAKSSCIFTQSQ
jgi:hypothetical protein